MVGGILPDTYPKTITMMILRAGFSSGPQIQSDHTFLVPMGAGTCFLPVPEGCAFCCACGAGACFFAVPVEWAEQMVPQLLSTTFRLRSGDIYSAAAAPGTPAPSWEAPAPQTSRRILGSFQP